MGAAEQMKQQKNAASRKTILVLLDGCRFDTGTENAGYLEHLIDRKQGARYRVLGELPSLSRPVYETIFTGLPSSVHGVTGDGVVRPSRFDNVFSLCRQNQLVTAAAAYGWISELYARPGRFDPLRDRYQLAGEGAIRHGIFYSEDSYPDSHLFGDGEFLRERYRPDFLLYHAMNLDRWGRQKGCDSPEYVRAAAAALELLGQLLPRWQEEGWQVVVTADHGVDRYGVHGGPHPGQRTVPLYLFTSRAVPGRYEQKEISQLELAPLLCRLLGLPPAPGMLEQLEIQFTDHQ